MFKSGDSGGTGTGVILTPDRAVITDGAGQLDTSVTTATELSYVHGVTSDIQTQLNSKQPTGNYITALTGDVGASGPGSVTATIQPGVIVNNMVAALAGIVYSKLNLSNSIVNGDINAAAAIAYSKLNLSTSIVNGDIAVAAAIARTKLASGTANHVLINDASGVMSSEAQLAITRGGTGQSTANAALNALLPSQGGNSGKVLGTDGSNTSWVTGSYTAPKVTTFKTVGTTTWTATGSPLYIRVRAVGGGGGGGGGSTVSANNGSDGADGEDTTFGGASLISAGGGKKGIGSSRGYGGLGGTAFINASLKGIAVNGGQGGAPVYGANGTTQAASGGQGGSSAFGGAGGSNNNTNPAVLNSGSGGGGGVMGLAGSAVASGSGGGSGAFVDVIITSPSSSYTVVVGNYGSGGNGGTGASAPGYEGGTGMVEVTEYYQ